MPGRRSGCCRSLFPRSRQSYVAAATIRRSRGRRTATSPEESEPVIVAVVIPTLVVAPVFVVHAAAFLLHAPFAIADGIAMALPRGGALGMAMIVMPMLVVGDEAATECERKNGPDQDEAFLEGRQHGSCSDWKDEHVPQASFLQGRPVVSSDRKRNRLL